MFTPIKSIFRQMGLGLTQQHAPEMSATIHKKDKRNKHFNPAPVESSRTSLETGTKNKNL